MADVEDLRRAGRLRVFLVAALVLGACLLTWVFHARLGSAVLFTHAFYLPIILASLWWMRRGILVAAILGIVLLTSHFLFLGNESTTDDVVRALAFIAVSAVVAVLSERIAAREAALVDYQARLRRLASELANTEQRERRLIAADLHDRVSRTMAVCKIKAGLLRDSVGKAHAAAADDLVCLVDQANEETRTVMLQACPPMLYDLGLVPALEWLADQFEQDYGLACGVSATETVPAAGDAVRGLVFAAVRELLLNTVKYAKARRADIFLRAQGEALAIRVEDDGVGFDPSALPPPGKRSGGFGLFSIRERLRDLGGRLEIDSQPGHGARITIVVPSDDASSCQESKYAGACSAR